jgi:hypothetical protein
MFKQNTKHNELHVERARARAETYMYRRTKLPVQVMSEICGRVSET